MTLRLTQLFQGENIDKIFEYPGDKSKMLTVQFATSHLDENEREREIILMTCMKEWSGSVYDAHHM